nr:TylF/MycF/NovP-related O-methyltransferase [Afipia felis]
MPGDIVECGVWRGGSALLASLAVRENDTLLQRRGWFGRPARKCRTWLYDTFDGMTAPSESDVDLTGTSASEYMKVYSHEGKWRDADETDVRGALWMSISSVSPLHC